MASETINVQMITATVEQIIAILTVDTAVSVVLRTWLMVDVVGCSKNIMVQT